MPSRIPGFWHFDWALRAARSTLLPPSKIPRFGHYHWAVCRFPSRSPGPLGIYDGADPNVISKMGDSPGTLGIHDFADPLWGVNAPDFGAPGTAIKLQDGSAATSGTSAEQSTNAANPSSATTAPIITTNLLTIAEPSNLEAYYLEIVDIMNAYATAYSINTKLRIAHFLAQVSHESDLIAIREEGGNYQAKQMRKTFGCRSKNGVSQYDASTDDCKLVTDKPDRLREKLWSAEKDYAHNPQKLFSYVYADRFKNGNEDSGDGYKYRGRGMMQLTFKANYESFTTMHNAKCPDDIQDFVANPDLVATTRYGVESAFFFWSMKGLNAIADKDDVEAVTKAVNGGQIGLADRKSRLARIRKALEI